MAGMLSGNTLKIIAAISMLLDHAGLMLFPKVILFRILGRLAFPIYAFMIAEGCRYTRSKLRYFLNVFVLAAVCQIVYYIVDGSLYFSILVTFSLSILMIYALQAFQHALEGADIGKKWISGLVFLASVAAVYGLNRAFEIDYGFWGCMVPVFVSLDPGNGENSHRIRVGLLGLGLLFLMGNQWGIQGYCLLTLPLLLAYSGKRGKGNMKYFFYIFYPAHLVILEGIVLLMA